VRGCLEWVGEWDKSKSWCQSVAVVAVSHAGCFPLLTLGLARALDAQDGAASLLEVRARIAKVVEMHYIDILVRAMGPVRAKALRADWPRQWVESDEKERSGLYEYTHRR
jgi:hypothetical protein